MKKIFINLFANPDKSGQVVRKIVALGVVFLLLLAAVSCESAKKPYEDDEEEVTFSLGEISLTGTSCEWIRREPVGYELIIINSDSELQNYIICTDERRFPSIDFSRYTLLLARGLWGNQCYPDSVELLQLSPGNYELNIDFPGGSLKQVIRSWHVAIITNKLNDNDTVKLNVTRRIPYIDTEY